jgi:peptidoglycan/LPS O-acetylase OafA/YrhL
MQGVSGILPIDPAGTCGLSLSFSSAYITNGLLYGITPLRADGFLLGGLLALMLRGPESRVLDNLLRPVFYLMIIGFGIFEIAYRIRAHHFFVPGFTPILSTLGYSLINIFCAVLILLSLDTTSYFYRFFSLRPLRQLGQMSYGFYIFHDIPHGRHFYGNGPQLRYVIAGIAMICTLLLSYLSFRFFETPFLRLKDRFTV